MCKYSLTLSINHGPNLKFKVASWPSKGLSLCKKWINQEYLFTALVNDYICQNVRMLQLASSVHDHLKIAICMLMTSYSFRYLILKCHNKKFKILLINLTVWFDTKIKSNHKIWFAYSWKLLQIVSIQKWTKANCIINCYDICGLRLQFLYSFQLTTPNKIITVKLFFPNKIWVHKKGKKKSLFHNKILLTWCYSRVYSQMTKKHT